MRRLLVVLVLAGAATGARAATCTGVSTVGLTFAAYDVFAALPNDTAVGSVTYNCNTTPAVTISASFNGAQGPRQMIFFPFGGPDLLQYDVFVDAARTVVWSSTAPQTLPSGARTIPFYGRIFAGQDVAVGTYADLLTVTLNF